MKTMSETCLTLQSTHRVLGHAFMYRMQGLIHFWGLCLKQRGIWIAGSALQNLSADEEVLEKEYEGIPRLKSTLKIKSKPKTKHQKGTYRRGRRPEKSGPVSNNPSILGASASTTGFQSEAFDLDLTDQQSWDEQQMSSMSGDFLEGSVLAPSQAQQDQYESRSAEASSSAALSRRTQPGNGVSNAGSTDSERSAQRGSEEGRGQGEWEGSDASSSRQSASNTLATRDAGEQAAARVQEPISEEQQGYSLMW